MNDALQTLTIFANPSKYRPQNQIKLRFYLAIFCGDAPLTPNQELKFSYAGCKVRHLELESPAKLKYLIKVLQMVGIEVHVPVPRIFPIQVSAMLKEKYCDHTP